MLIEKLYKENIEKDSEVLCKDITHDIYLWSESVFKRGQSKFKPLTEEGKNAIKEVFFKTYMLYLEDISKFNEQSSDNLLESLEDLELIGVADLFNKTTLAFEKSNDLEKELLFYLINQHNFETFESLGFVPNLSLFLGTLEQNNEDEVKAIENIITRKEKENNTKNENYNFTYKELDHFREGYISIMKDNLLIMKEVIEEVKFATKKDLFYRTRILPYIKF